MLRDDERRRHLALVARDQLASVMNDTKWEELAAAMQTFQPVPDWRCKEISAAGPGPWDREWHHHIRPFHTIEWLEIGFVNPPYSDGGSAGLTATERATAERLLRSALSALAIPFSLEDGVVRVWGYTRPGSQPAWAD